MTQPAAIADTIVTVRGQRVLVDAELASLYGVPTRALNQAVKRNTERFPEDFAFQLTAREWGNLRSQLVTSSLQLSEDEAVTAQRRGLGRGSHGGRRTPPWVFTEHGAIMAACVLNSPAAVSMSVFVVRAFVQMREQLAANAAILKRLAEIDRTLLEHDQALQVVWRELQPLLAPPPAPARRRIGFTQDGP